MNIPIQKAGKYQVQDVLRGKKPDNSEKYIDADEIEGARNIPDYDDVADSIDTEI